MLGEAESPVMVESSKDVVKERKLDSDCAHVGDAGMPGSVFVLPLLPFCHEVNSLLCYMPAPRHASIESRQAPIDWNF